MNETINGAVQLQDPFKLVHVPGDWRLGNVWDFVKAGVEEVLRKSHGIFRYRPEDVYLLLRMGKANLYLAHWQNELRGFGITQVMSDPFGFDPPWMLSFCGYCSHRATRLRFFAELEVIAKSLKLGEIRHITTRHGFLVDKPGPEWMTLTAEGWIKDLTREQRQRLSLAAELTQRVVLK